MILKILVTLTDNPKAPGHNLNVRISFALQPPTGNVQQVWKHFTVMSALNWIFIMIIIISSPPPGSSYGMKMHLHLI